MIFSLKISSEVEINSISSQMTLLGYKPSFSLSFKNSKLVVLQLLIILSNKSFLTNILFGWNVTFGVNSFLLFCPDESYRK